MSTKMMAHFSSVLNFIVQLVYLGSIGTNEQECRKIQVILLGDFEKCVLKLEFFPTNKVDEIAKMVTRSVWHPVRTMNKKYD